MKEELIVSLDPGSDKIAGMVATARDNSIKVIGAHRLEYEQEVVRRGRVVDLEGLTQYVLQILKELEQQTSKPLRLVNLCVGGGFVRGWLASKVMPLESKRRKITNSDLELLLRQIQNESKFSSDAKILHLLPQEYVVDGETRVKKSPEGMFGNSVESKVHICVVSNNPLQNFIQCVKNAESLVDRIYPHSWACAEHLLSEEEKKRGVLLIDFGKGTTDFLVYIDGNLVATYSIPVGGEFIDRDISQILGTPIQYAEELKKNYGWCNFDLLNQEKVDILQQRVKVYSISGKLQGEVQAGAISRIVYERIYEILTKVIRGQIERHLKDLKSPAYLGAGIVVTGGSSLLKGFVSAVERIFGRPTRIGIPKGLHGVPKNCQYPEYSAVIGVLFLRYKELLYAQEPEPPLIGKITKVRDKILSRLNNWWDKW